MRLDSAQQCPPIYMGGHCRCIKATPDTWAQKGTTARTSMPVMTQTTRRVTYRGEPAGASLLADLLQREGVTVEWERPDGQRSSIGEMKQQVIVEMVAAGNLLAIKVAVAKFRKHMHDKTETGVTIEDDDPED